LITKPSSVDAIELTVAGLRQMRCQLERTGGAGSDCLLLDRDPRRSSADLEILDRGATMVLQGEIKGGRPRYDSVTAKGSVCFLKAQPAEC
jgi:hypothetical protein